MDGLYRAIYNNIFSYALGGLVVGFFLGWLARK